MPIIKQGSISCALRNHRLLNGRGIPCGERSSQVCKGMLLFSNESLQHNEAFPLNLRHQSVFAGDILYAPTIVVFEISTLLLYARIFPGKDFNRMLRAVGLFTSTCFIIMVLTVTFQCRPLCLPQPQLWIFQVHRGTKVQLIGISALGFCA